MPAIEQLDDGEARRCFACGGLFVPAGGPTHAYMLATPGCWATYGELLAREYENRDLFNPVHRLTVDAYALQHPGDPADRRAVQSVWVHYAALFLALEKGERHQAIPPVMRKLVRQTLPPLGTPPTDFAITHADVYAAPADKHAESVQRWAHCAYESWSHLHETTRSLLAEVS